MQQFGEDILPLLLLFAISVTGIDADGELHVDEGVCVRVPRDPPRRTVIVTLVWLPFGKCSTFPTARPARRRLLQGRRRARRAGGVRAMRATFGRSDGAQLITVEQELGFRTRAGGGHYQHVCPRCRRASSGLRRARCGESERSGAPRRHVPADPLRIIQQFGPHLSAMTGERSVHRRRAGQAGEDALLLLRAAVRHPAQGARTTR